MHYKFLHPCTHYSDQWPSGRPLPPEYEIEFSDGCIPPNLHNASDCPSNFPTLDTLPREQRPSDYSDAYDGHQPEGESNLLINPAVAAVVASKAGMVTSPILPGIGASRRSVSIPDEYYVAIWKNKACYSY